MLFVYGLLLPPTQVALLACSTGAAALSSMLAAQALMLVLVLELQVQTALCWSTPQPLGP